MELIKSRWVADGQNVHLNMPISKVNKETRTVSGFATLDNVDQEGDVVLAEASKNAFQRFKGNIREMHEPIAAGRLVNFKEDSYYDSETKKFYRGIYVTVYVSKGAQPTWEKVLDGTLSGFSIGGSINDSSTEFVKDAGPSGRTVRFIKDFDLNELSLVDNPCNQFANVFSFQKNQGVTLMKGMAAETHLSNIFWCNEHGIAKSSSDESEVCGSCETAMEVIGWFEKGDDEAVRVQETVAKFLRQKEDDNAAESKANNATGEGGVEKMANDIEKSDAGDVVTSEDVTEGSDEGVEEVASEDTEDKAAEVEETAGEPDFEKMFDALKDSVNETFEKNKNTIEKAVQAVKSEVAEVTKSFDEKASEFEKSLGELSEKLNGITSLREDVEKRLNTLEKATAIKKSGDVEGQVPEKKLQKGLWSGTFFETE